MQATKQLYYVTTILAIYLFACDREDPMAPESSIEETFTEQSADSILVKNPDLDSHRDSSEEETTIEEELTVPETPSDEAEKEDGDVIDTPNLATYSIYRINISMMKNSCPGNTVNIEELKFKYKGEYLSDTFSSYPNDPNPIYNDGSIGVYPATISTSGDYNAFYPFEAFGGGYGAGWWSSQNSFEEKTPAPAITDVWFEVSFGDQQLGFDAIYINGGSTLLGNNFKSCSPQNFTITGSNNGIDWQVLANVRDQDTEEGMEIKLDYPELISSQS